VDQLAQLVVADVVEGAVHQAKGHLTEADAAPYFEQVRDYLAALPVDRFPRTVAMAHTLTQGDGDERFEFGLHLMISGLLSYAGKRG